MSETHSGQYILKNFQSTNDILYLSSSLTIENSAGHTIFACVPSINVNTRFVHSDKETISPSSINFKSCKLEIITQSLSNEYSQLNSIISAT